MLKYLRIAVTALGVTVCVLLVALWVRSYWCEDRLANYMVEIGGTRTGGYVFRSREGNLLIPTYDPMNDPDVIPPLTYRWYVETERIAGPMTPTLANKSTTNALWRFGIRRSDEALYVNVPHWFLKMLSGALFAISRCRQSSLPRFSLRTLLIATPLVAVGLGMIAIFGWSGFSVRSAVGRWA